MMIQLNKIWILLALGLGIACSDMEPTEPNYDPLKTSVANSEKLLDKEWWSQTPFVHVHYFKADGTYNGQGKWGWINESDSMYTQEIENLSDSIIWQIKDITQNSFWAKTKKSNGYMEFTYTP
jgi:hypothetical protein